jgi:hypothetical protein
VLWLLGPTSTTQVDEGAAGPAPAHTSRLFAAGGYGVMRDSWDQNANHAVIDCGPHGALNCGHAHSDALSIEIAALGRPVVVDTGTFTYTGPTADRDHFRHSASHNTVTVDGQSSSVPAGPFAWQSRADARVERWWSGTLADYFVGSHEGFARLPDPALHRRRVLFVRHGYWVIGDTIEARGQHKAAVHLHLPADARVSATGRARAHVEVGSADNSLRVLFHVGGDARALEWSDGWISPVYGTRMRAPHGLATSRGVGRHDILTAVVPVSDGHLSSVRDVPCEGGVGLVVEEGDRRDILLFQRDGIVRGDAIEMNGDAALVRRSVATGMVLEVALFGCEARLRAGALTFHAAGAAEFCRTSAGWNVQGAGRVTASDAGLT